MSTMKAANLQFFLIFVLNLFSLTSQAKVYEVKELSYLEINSAITPASYDYLDYQLKNIPDNALIVIKLNTPGGLISTTKDIITLIGSQKRPLAVWITPQGASAASAGAIIAAAAHFIFMSPGTNMGAATPVGLGEDIKEKDGRSKAMNDLKAMVRSLSQMNNRPSGPFEEMIESAKSFTDQEAKALKIIDGIIHDEAELRDILQKRSFVIQGEVREIEFSKNVISQTYSPTLGQKLLNILANPSTAYFLFLIGAALLYFELQAPGGYISGGIGIVFLILAAISFQVLPLNLGALGLVIIGVVLLILEFYITSYGLLALGGLASLVAGSLFLFHGEGGYISVNYPILVSTLLGVLTSFGIIIWYLVKQEKKKSIPSSFFLPLDSTGIVVTKTSGATPTYQVKVKGEIWRCESENELNVGDKVKVLNIDSNNLIAQIKKIDKE